MSLFKDHIIDPVKAGLAKPDAGIPIPMEKLARFTNYIERGQNIVIGGKPTSGKTSLMDYLYFINVFKWWRDLDIPEDQKPPLKFYYFNLKEKERIKVQKWFCLMLKLEFDTVMDIPTLNSDIGRLYDLSNTDKEYIQAGDEFMDDLEEHLVFVNKPQTPSDIYNYVKNELDQIGDFDENGTFHYDDDHKGQLTFVLTNTIDHLSSESDGYQMMNQDALKKKFGTYMCELRDVYKTTNVWVAPSKVTNSRMVRDSEPSYKELGYSANVCDLGLITYNPFNENNNSYLNYPINDMIIRGKNRLRTVTIVRNSRGLENITVGLIFLGECGYHRESPHPSDETLWDDFQELLRELP